MSGISRKDAINIAVHREERRINMNEEAHTHYKTVSQIYGENVFNLKTAESIPEEIRKQIMRIPYSSRQLTREQAMVIAGAVTEWATSRGATHFCHWFQPLTGKTAEKHDSFIDFSDKDRLQPIARLSANQLMQGEPDASSFPHGGVRATFEARGYTSWDLTSPMFLEEGVNGKILCIPTAFTSYHLNSLDIKTPLLRSVSKIDSVATEFLKLTGKEGVEHVHVSCGAEQEYFLVDKAFYYSRPDLVMTGRTLFGSNPIKNQQLSDHYFGTVPERILSFMQELDVELLRLGIPIKTRHNEVAPGQFEVAPLFTDANLAADQNQLMMTFLNKVAQRHDLVALLHEKPFAGVNGSGKHLNWSLSDNTGMNLLQPGYSAIDNYRFLTMVAVIVEAVYRHADMLRVSVVGSGNDHR